MLDLVIIGSGPAGLMAAVQATKRNLNFILLEKNSVLGKKLRITGSTKCNVTNHYSTQEFIEQISLRHNRFLFSSIQEFGPMEVKQYFEENGVELVLEKEFKYFPKSMKSVDILNALTKNIQKQAIHLSEEVKNITYKNGFTIKTTRDTYECSNVLIATGSKSYPKTGSTGFGALIASKLGHNVIPFYPAETSLYVPEIANHKEYLQGIAIQQASLVIKDTKRKFHGDYIFTHFGLSGPLIQKASEHIYHSLKDKKNIVELSLTPISLEKIMTLSNVNSNLSIQQFLESILIKRLVRYVMKANKIKNIKLKEISVKEKQDLFKKLKAYPFTVRKVESIENAYVNGGGVDTKEINPKTMESKIIKGLYFAGEVMDVHGPIGGFNITIALSSGYKAVNAIK